MNLVYKKTTFCWRHTRCLQKISGGTHKQRHHFADKGPYSQSYGFSSSCVWMWELDHKEGWAPNNWCFWTVVLEKILASPLDCKEITPVNCKGNQSWIFIGRTDAEAKAHHQMAFNFMAAVTICSDFGAQENKVCPCFHSVPIYLPCSDRTGCLDVHWWWKQCL